MKKTTLLSTNLIALCFLLIYTDIAVLADDSLTIGVFTRRNSSVTIKMFRPLAKYVEAETGIKIKLETAKNFPDFWKRVQSKRYDIAHFNQLHYILSKESIGYEVFAKNEEFGASELAPAIIVRKDSGINTLEDLKGKTIIFGGGKLAMIANISVKNLLSNAGLNSSTYKTIIGKNPPNAALAVFFKRADAAGTGDIALSVPILKNKLNVSELKYLFVGNKQPHLPWVIKKSIKPEIKERIITAFLKLNDSKKGKKILKNAAMTGILPAIDKEFDVSRKVFKQYKANNPK